MVRWMGEWVVEGGGRCSTCGPSTVWRRYLLVQHIQRGVRLLLPDVESKRGWMDELLEASVLLLVGHGDDEATTVTSRGGSVGWTSRKVHYPRESCDLRERDEMSRRRVSVVDAALVEDGRWTLEMAVGKEEWARSSQASQVQTAITNNQTLYYLFPPYFLLKQRQLDIQRIFLAKATRIKRKKYK